MFKLIRNKKGVALFIVLGVIVIVATLVTVILAIILSQARLTQHQLSRIQAYYAARGGLIYAYERRFVNAANWPDPATFLPNRYYQWEICNGSLAGCVINGGDLNEPDLPITVQRVVITVAASGVTPPGNIPGCNPCSPPFGTSCICSQAIYTY